MTSKFHIKLLSKRNPALKSLTVNEATLTTGFKAVRSPAFSAMPLRNGQLTRAGNANGQPLGWGAHAPSRVVSGALAGTGASAEMDRRSNRFEVSVRGHFRVEPSGSIGDSHSLFRREISDIHFQSSPPSSSDWTIRQASSASAAPKTPACRTRALPRCRMNERSRRMKRSR